MAQQLCASCGRGEVSEKLLRCSACKSVAYCNRACQRADWVRFGAFCEAHRVLCRSYGSSPLANSDSGGYARQAPEQPPETSCDPGGGTKVSSSLLEQSGCDALQSELFLGQELLQLAEAAGEDFLKSADDKVRPRVLYLGKQLLQLGGRDSLEAAIMHLPKALRTRLTATWSELQ
eukprot:TRINITY_DN114303_c0_g1_i1.p1 TRINITY_DN114303_c0_g1~~TRINITY_DN114303_c0_g1_i1.p1  ORF type:complete len:176 (+),score=43.45 TRINITY_DN114303_c0_g1_i1:29-556(+)